MRVEGAEFNVVGQSSVFIVEGLGVRVKPLAA